MCCNPPDGPLINRVALSVHCAAGQGLTAVWQLAFRARLGKSATQPCALFARLQFMDLCQCKLELVVGSPASCMELELYTPDDKFVMKLDRDEALLGSYPVDDGYRIHVIDRSGATIGEYEDVSRVEKFQISDTEYDKRADSARSFMKRSHLGQYNKEEMSRKESELEQKLVEEKALAEAIPVGARCEVRVSGQPSKRGTVMYVGLTEFKPGYLVGIKYDEPLGKHDGR
uniref:Tubulin folding cofactor B n=1 Tax=Naja naja TaxID=35670 RepID=A0A8C6YAX7_NAJNA